MVAVALVALLILTPLLGARWIDHRELGWQRDRWLVGMVAVGVLFVAWYELMLGAALVAVLAWWRHERTLPSVVTWAAITGLWFLVRALETDARVMVVVGLLVVAVLETVLILVQSATGLAPMGTFGHRTLAGAFLAMLCPLAFTAHWAVGVVVLVGILVTCSWTAWAASAVAFGWLAPWTLLVSGSLVVALSAFSWPLWGMMGPRGDVWIDRHLGIRGVSLDGLRARLISWAWLVRGLSIRGHGPGSTDRGLMEGFVRAGHRGLEGSPAHNDVLEYVYDYGALGMLTVGLAAWRILPALTPATPLSAAVLAGLVLMQGTSLLQSPATGVPWVIVTAWVVG